LKFDKNSYTGESFSKELITMGELSRIKFSNCLFRWTDFTDVEVLYGCTFESCDFTNARLNGVNIKNCNFLSCKFENTSFFATTLDDCKMTGSDFMDADCAMLQIVGGDWSYTNLRKQSFQKQDLSNIRFSSADLSECHFNQCKMNNCEFDEAIVHETSFYKSDLRHSSIDRLDILNASFRQAKLDIEQCIIIAEYVTEGRYTPDCSKQDDSKTIQKCNPQSTKS